MPWLTLLFPVESRPNWPPRLGIQGSEPLPVWMSMVDEKTGDATFVPYSNFNYFSRYQDWEEGSFYRLALPVVARTPGRNGSHWQTDLFGFAASPRRADTPSPYFYPADPENQCGGDASGLYAHLIEGEMGMPLDGMDDEGEAYEGHSWAYVSVVDNRTNDPIKPRVSSKNIRHGSTGFYRISETRQTDPVKLAPPKNRHSCRSAGGQARKMLLVPRFHGGKPVPDGSFLPGGLLAPK